MDFEKECACLQAIRAVAPADNVTLRLDANGGLTMTPIPRSPSRNSSGWRALTSTAWSSPFAPVSGRKCSSVCAKGLPIPIALDEELIGVHDTAPKAQPPPPGQTGLRHLEAQPDRRFRRGQPLDRPRRRSGCQWWATSALESNIGLNAIAQWAADATLEAPDPIPQGLGTGSLFTDNVPSPLVVENGTLRMETSNTAGDPAPLHWDLSSILS